LKKKQVQLRELFIPKNIPYKKLAQYYRMQELRAKELAWDCQYKSFSQHDYEEISMWLP
jgi:hypothetical protein